MRIGVIGGGPGKLLGDLLDEADRARGDGLSSYWLSQDTGADLLTAIAVIGRAVPDIEFGVSVTPTFLRHPMTLAVQALTVQQATEGRLVLHVGPPLPHNRESFSGYIFEQPVIHVRRVVTVLRKLLRGELMDDMGLTMAVRGRADVEASAPPILMSAFKPAMLRFAGEEADGIVTWMVGHKTLANYVVPQVKHAAASAQRPAPRVLAAVAACVTTRAEHAIDSARERLSVFGAMASYRSMLDREGVMWPHDLLLVGTEDEVRDGLLEFEKCGATDVLVAELCPDEDSARRTRGLLASLAQ
ncbi:MAG TPA: TIGR03564 family F420-dependent LLM class oxidoreductase [Candidatus Binataceae bacterium]|nr:TIGR03564 family F420-dependent LLM class oxidoreductase [Candidatus Binataceae bacterium]